MLRSISTIKLLTAFTVCLPKAKRQNGPVLVESNKRRGRKRRAILLAGFHFHGPLAGQPRHTLAHCAKVTPLEFDGKWNVTFGGVRSG